MDQLEKFTMGTVVGTFTSVDHKDMHFSSVQLQKLKNSLEVSEHLASLHTETYTSCKDKKQENILAASLSCYQGMFSE